ncbi:MAG: phage tail tape measure protein [Methyloprofundus sp.]|nr:phage tail tape measure protein [Methyloprofundus sp.]
MANNLALGIVIGASVSGTVSRAINSVRHSIGNIVTDNNRLINSERRLQRQLERTNTHLRNRERRSQLNGQIISTVGIAFAAAAPIREAIAFETVMADVNKVTNLSSAEFKGMGKSILDMSTTMPMAASGIGAIVAAAGQSGVAKDELLSFAQAAATMGVAFDISGEQSGKMMADWRSGMGLNQTQTVALADAVNHLSNNMNASAAAIGEVIQRQGAVAKASGLSAIQTAALSGALLSSGAAPEIAATALKNMTGALTKGEAATKSQKEAFTELGFSAVDMASMMQDDAAGSIQAVLEAISEAPIEQQSALVSQLFGEESKGAIMPLLVNMGTLNKAFADTADSTKYAGSMQAEYDVRSKTTANSLTLLKNQTTRLGISLGSVLLPGLNAVVGIFGGVIGGITSAAEAFPLLTKVIVGAAVGLAAFKVISLGVGYAATFLSDGWTIARGVIDFFRLSTLQANISMVRQKAIVIGLAIQQKALAAWTAIVTTAQWAWNVALNANPIGLVVAGVAAFGALAYTVYKNWEPIMAWFTDKFGFIGKTVNWIGDKWTSVFGGGGNATINSSVSTELPLVQAIKQADQEAKAANNNTTKNDIKINIQQNAGEDQAALAKRVADELERRQKSQQRGALYDGI